MNYTELAVFAAYFLFMLGIGIFFFLRSKDAGEKDYFLGGRQMGKRSQKAEKAQGQHGSRGAGFLPCKAQEKGESQKATLDRAGKEAVKAAKEAAKAA